MTNFKYPKWFCYVLFLGGFVILRSQLNPLVSLSLIFFVGGGLCFIYFKIHEELESKRRKQK